MKVLGIGDNVVDKYVHQRTMYPGGNALNFSVFAKGEGADAAFLGVFGDDDEARLVENTLQQWKSISHIADIIAERTDVHG